MQADQAFMDRIHRIESGRQWAPDGVIMPDREAMKRRRKPVNAGQKRVSFVLSLVLASGLAWVLVQNQPELVGQIMTGDFSSVTAVLEDLPLPKELPGA